jgi:coenzyme F420-reducing hydrogenase delta subunit
MGERDVVVYVCHNSVGTDAGSPEARRRLVSLKRGKGARVSVVPCSGKIDVVYVLKAFETGARGVAVITCPPGECRMIEGNVRAGVRLEHIGQMLDEIGLGRERLLLLHGGAAEQGRDVPVLIDQAVARLGNLPASPLRTTGESVGAESK